MSVGVDWNPSGSDTLFDELRVAAKVNEEEFGGVIPSADWIKMITTNPAKTLALEAYVGTLAAGFKADLTVLASQDADPAQSVLKTHLQDVHMVWVAGDLLYADRTILETVKPGQCEPLAVHGSHKRLCVRDTTDPVTKSTQTFADIRDALQAAYPQLAPLAP